MTADWTARLQANLESDKARLEKHQSDKEQQRRDAAEQERQRVRQRQQWSEKLPDFDRAVKTINATLRDHGRKRMDYQITEANFGPEVTLQRVCDFDNVTTVTATIRYNDNGVIHTQLGIMPMAHFASVAQVKPRPLEGLDVAELVADFINTSMDIDRQINDRTTG